MIYVISYIRLYFVSTSENRFQYLLHTQKDGCVGAVTAIDPPPFLGTPPQRLDSRDWKRRKLLNAMRCQQIWSEETSTGRQSTPGRGIHPNSSAEKRTHSSQPGRPGASRGVARRGHMWQRRWGPGYCRWGLGDVTEIVWSTPRGRSGWGAEHRDGATASLAGGGSLISHGSIAA